MRYRFAPGTRKAGIRNIARSIEMLERRLLMSRAVGIDVSHYQGTINWSSVAAAGTNFAFAKATEGISYVDPTTATNTSGAQANGVLIGVYHFAHPDTNTATAEANWFLQNASQYVTNGYLRPVLDLEDGSSLSSSALSGWVNSWCGTVQQSTGVDPIIYCNTNYATNEVDSSVTGHALWIANWSTSYGDPLTTGSPPDGVWGPSNWGFWQYTDAGSVPGISGAVDQDVFQQDLSTLQTNFVIGSTPPTPGAIAGSVFLDNNGNGVLDTGEGLLPNRTVYIDSNNNGVLDTGEQSTLTDATGHYSMTVNPGTYNVRQVEPGGWYQTVPANNAAHAAVVTSGQTTTLFAFGSAQFGSISGTVFNDTNGDGIQDNGEAGLSSWIAYIDANGNGKRDSGELTTTTDANGNYAFNNLQAGTYVVRISQKKGKRYHLTVPSNGYYNNTLFSGTVITGDNFGEQ